MKLRALLAEFIGTFALIFVGVMAIATNAGTNDISRTGIALAHGFTIAVMASATMAISGGHLNPAVSFGAWIASKITFVRMIGYWVAQLAGGVAGAFAAGMCAPQMNLINSNYGIPSVSMDIMPDEGFAFTAMFVELILTFLLMYVILGTAIDKRAHKMAGLFIGLAVTLDILAGGPLTGAAMNPARWFGPALYIGTQTTVSHTAWVNWPVYVAGPLLGAALAVFLYGKKELAEA